MKGVQMKIQEIQGLTNGYLEQLEGTSEWYYCKQCETSFCDLYEAEEIIKETGEFAGATCYLVHYPDGEVIRPFEMRKNCYVEAPVFDDGKIGFLEVDFEARTIRIHYYLPEERRLVTLAELPLDSVKDCYNLSLRQSPLLLGRDANDGKYEVIWPVRKNVPIGEAESLMFCDGDKMYFASWYEDPEYHEEVVIRLLQTGEELERFPGTIQRMPDGTYWRL